MDFINFWTGLRNRAREEKLTKQNEVLHIKEMPFVYGLFSTAFSAGLSPERALNTVATYVPEVFSQVMERSLHEVTSGKSMNDALHHLTDHEHLRSLGFVLLESSESGISGISTLDALHRESVATVRRETERAIKKLPITMLFPLVVCILPAFILLSVVPVVVQGLTSLQW